MHCPNLTELPSPPPNKTGWPWTEESAQLDEIMPDGASWPKVSIVTPSYNQGQFIEETIRSVLLQGYPNLEYLVIDGGSTDGSVEIIKKYERWLTYWASEKDRGQAHAINKGFARATGEIFAWLNSDDTYSPGAFGLAASALSAHPEVILVYGNCTYIDEVSQIIGSVNARPTSTVKILLGENNISQQTAFMRRRSLQDAGGINPTLNYVMDLELWLRLGLHGSFLVVPSVLAYFRLHHSSKSLSQSTGFWVEYLSVLDQHTELKKQIPGAILEEAIRRACIRAAMEYFYAGDRLAAKLLLEQALAEARWPYGHSRALSWAMLNCRTISGRSWENSSGLIQDLTSILSELSNPAKKIELQRALVASNAVLQAFQAYGHRDMRKVRGYLLFAIRSNPDWLRDRTLLWMLARSFLPSPGTHLGKKLSTMRFHV